MKRLFVCGDSWMSPSVYKPKTHFSEIIAERIGYELVVYSRGGMSNLGICLQIESAIKEKPDFMLLNMTSFDRIEIPLDSKEWISDYTVNNIVYSDTTSLSSVSKLIGNNSPKLISDTLYCFLNEKGHFESLYKDHIEDFEEFKKTVKNYFKFMHNSSWKRRIDCWGLYSSLHKLHISQIPYLIVFSKDIIKNHCPWVDENKFVVSYPEYSWNIISDDPGYHTSEEDQVLISELIYNHLKQHNFISV